MGRKRLGTLGDLSRHGFRVLFRCPGCGHESRFEPLDIVLMAGMSRSIGDLRGACSRCDRRGVRAMIDPPGGGVP